MPTFTKHGHGGQLTQASEHYGIPLSEWIDLSTGISPFTYPLPNVPDECWQRLPESNDGLEIAATSYYGSEHLLPVSGSQEAIQKLPLLFPSPCNTGIITPAYHSHQQAWEKAGHNIVLLSPDEIESAVFSPDSSPVPSLDVLLLVNPTNPSTQTYTPDELLRWHKKLASQNGYLIIDEAFIDSTPEQSLIEQKTKPGLIVLRSIGKFFGLAGIRLGFVWAEVDILEKLSFLQDDWSVSNPARWAGKTALADKPWQLQQRARLNHSSLRLKQLLDCFSKHYDSNNDLNNNPSNDPGRDRDETTTEQSNDSPVSKTLQQPYKSGGVSFNDCLDVAYKELNGIHNKAKHTTLFSYIEHPDAPMIHEALAKLGILTRLFNKSANEESSQTENALRFGLPANEDQWLRLQQSLSQVANSISHD